MARSTPAFMACDSHADARLLVYRACMDDLLCRATYDEVPDFRMDDALSVDDLQQLSSYQGMMHEADNIHLFHNVTSSRLLSTFFELRELGVPMGDGARVSPDMGEDEELKTLSGAYLQLWGSIYESYFPVFVTPGSSVVFHGAHSMEEDDLCARMATSDAPLPSSVRHSLFPVVTFLRTYREKYSTAPRCEDSHMTMRFDPDTSRVYCVCRPGHQCNAGVGYEAGFFIVILFLLGAVVGGTVAVLFSTFSLVRSLAHVYRQLRGISHLLTASTDKEHAA